MAARLLKNYVLVTIAIVIVIICCVRISSRDYLPIAAFRKPPNVQRCVHDPVPCPRLFFPERTNASLIDLDGFKYVLNTNPCADESLLVLVHSSAGHFKERETIRTSWSAGSGWLKNLTIRVVFFLAEVEDPSLQTLIAHENRFHGDTVQGNFIDSYRNLTYKHVMALRWAVDNCPRVPRVMKMDDDIFVHVFNLAKVVDLTTDFGSAWIACYVQKQMPIVRSPGSKWKVEETDYPGAFYEDYCSGWAYITEPTTLLSVVEESKYRPYFWVDDVHVTGTLARMAGVELKRMNEYYTSEAESLDLWTRSDQKDHLDWKFAFGPTWGDSDLVRTAHLRAKWCRKMRCKCCFEVGRANRVQEGGASVTAKAVIVPVAI